MGRSIASIKQYFINHEHIQSAISDAKVKQQHHLAAATIVQPERGEQ